MQNNNKKVQAEKLFSPMKFFSLPSTLHTFLFFPLNNHPWKKCLGCKYTIKQPGRSTYDRRLTKISGKDAQVRYSLKKIK